MAIKSADNHIRHNGTRPRADNDILIRPFQPGDQQQCVELFTMGMEQLIGLVTQVVFPRYLRYALMLVVIAILPSVTLSSWILPGVLLVCLIALAALYVDVYMECWKFINHCLNTDLRDIQKSYMMSTGSQMVVAEFEGKVVGMVGLIHLENHARGSREVELQRMSVSTELRGLGIARKLLDNVCHFAKEANYEKIVLSTTSAQKPAIRLYKRYGFTLNNVFPYPQGILADLEYFSFDLPL